MAKALSFCITCMHRLHQLRRTLPKNLAHNARDRKHVEFILVDIGPTPGLLGWARAHCGKALATGYLKIFQTKATRFHAPLAKNTSHIHASGKILVNLDGDVLVGPRGGRKIINAMRRHKGRAVIHVSGKRGTYGCIAYPRRFFMGVRGYDQSFGPVGAQDTDIIVRLVGRYKLKYVVRQRVPINSKLLFAYLRSLKKGFRGTLVDKGLPLTKAIVNSKRDTIRHTKVKNWKRADKANHRILRRNIRRKRFVANKKKKGLGYPGVKRVK